MKMMKTTDDADDNVHGRRKCRENEEIMEEERKVPTGCSNANSSVDFVCGRE